MVAVRVILNRREGARLPNSSIQKKQDDFRELNATLGTSGCRPKQEVVANNCSKRIGHGKAWVDFTCSPLAGPSALGPIALSLGRPKPQSSTAPMQNFSTFRRDASAANAIFDAA